MTRGEKRRQATRRDTSKSRETQPLDVGDCSCYVQRATVGEDHNKDCLLYRQRGSGIPVLRRPPANARVGLWSARDRL
jgi:hypothetical protein